MSTVVVGAWKLNILFAFLSVYIKTFYNVLASSAIISTLSLHNLPPAPTLTMQHGQAASCWSNDDELFPPSPHSPRLRQEPVARVSSVAVVPWPSPELRVCQWTSGRSPAPTTTSHQPPAQHQPPNRFFRCRSSPVGSSGGGGRCRACLCLVALSGAGIKIAEYCHAATAETLSSTVNNHTAKKFPFSQRSPLLLPGTEDWRLTWTWI